jgi:hypothetical protein
MRGHIGLIGALALASMASAPVVEPEERKREPREPDPEPKPPVAESKVIPDRVSLEKDSPHFFPPWQKIGVRFNGGECNTIVEFCQSEGWARFQIFHGGRPKMERGRFTTMKRHGTVEPYWRSGR